MKKSKALWSGIVGAVILTCGGGYMVFGGSEQGSHTVHPVEGGEWDYGSSSGRTWSNFQHEKSHSASTQGHEFVDSGCVAGHSWARAEAQSRWLSALGDKQNKSVC